MKICLLASGSKGNAIYVSNGDCAVLVDAGLSGKEIERRLAAAHLSADHLDALIRMSGIRSPAAIVADETSVTFPPPLEALSVDEEVLATYGVDVVFGLAALEQAWILPEHLGGRVAQRRPVQHAVRAVAAPAGHLGDVGGVDR